MDLPLVEPSPVEPPQVDLPQLEPPAQNDLCDNNPDFAIICSFIQKFGQHFDLELDIEALRKGLENQEAVDQGLIDIHCKLFRKIRRYFVPSFWEKAIRKFASEYSYEAAYELDTFGYLKTSVSLKLELLRRLIEALFEHDQKFKTLINSLEADELRIHPTGRDIEGNTYWHSADKEGNLRVFTEEPLDYKSWMTICRTPEELGQLIEKLESSKDSKIKGEPKSEPYNPLPEIFPEFFNSHYRLETNGNLDTNQEPEQNGRESNETGKASKKGRKGSQAKRGKSNGEIKQAKLHESEIEIELKPKPSQIIPRYSISSDGDSVESQVNYTLESLINKVVSSIDYFLFKPLTRNFTDIVKQEGHPSGEKQFLDPTSPMKPPPPPPKKSRKRERPKTEELPRRSSSRIQQLQQKKEQEEIQKLIELTKEEKKPPSSPKASKPPKKEKSRWRDTAKGKKKRSWDKDDSESSPSTESDDDLDFMTTGADDQDDEFACEEEDTNIEPVIIKRARTAHQSFTTPEATTSIMEEDKPCGRCDGSNDPDCILLCDMCDDGYHLSCCIPPLMVVPDGDWYCPSCEHKTLLIKLNEIHQSVTKILTQLRMRRERLRPAPAARKQEKPRRPTPSAVPVVAEDEFEDDYDESDDVTEVESEAMTEYESEDSTEFESDITTESEGLDELTESDGSEELTESRSEYESSGDEIVLVTKKPRRAATRQVSYRESSDDEIAHPEAFYRDDEVRSESTDRQRTW